MIKTHLESGFNYIVYWTHRDIKKLQQRFSDWCRLSAIEYIESHDKN